MIENTKEWKLEIWTKDELDGWVGEWDLHIETLEEARKAARCYLAMNRPDQEMEVWLMPGDWLKPMEIWRRRKLQDELGVEIREVRA